MVTHREFSLRIFGTSVITMPRQFRKLRRDQIRRENRENAGLTSQQSSAWQIVTAIVIKMQF